MQSIQFTAPLVIEFIKVTTQALIDEKESFVFEDVEIHTTYAVLVIGPALVQYFLPELSSPPLAADVMEVISELKVLLQQQENTNKETIH